MNATVIFTVITKWPYCSCVYCY